MNKKGRRIPVRKLKKFGAPDTEMAVMEES
jgi:hypothetical protein